MTTRPIHSIHITEGNRGRPEARILPILGGREVRPFLLRRGNLSHCKIENPAEAGPSVCMSVGLEGSHQASLGESTGEQVARAVALFSNPDGLGRFAVDANHVRHLTEIPHQTHTGLKVAGWGCLDSADVLQLDACGGGLCVAHVPKIGIFMNAPNIYAKYFIPESRCSRSQQ